MLKTFVVTEIWTRSRVVTAKSATWALRKGDPDEHPLLADAPDADAIRADGKFEVAGADLGLNLSNWHATEVK